MRNRDMEQIGRTCVVQNKKRHKLKGCGLINFDSSLNPVDNISEQIKRDILRKFDKSCHKAIRCTEIGAENFCQGKL